MRIRILHFVTSILFTLSVSAQNPLPNSGFEDWTQYSGGLGSTFREPDNWNSSNQCSKIIANYSVSRSSEAHSGSYSAQLKTKSAFGNVLINGLISTSRMICGTNSGGIAGGLFSNLVPDSIAFWYTYAPEGVDTAYVQVILLSASYDTLSYVKGKIHTATSAWKRASFAIPEPSATPDSISVLLNSSWGDGSMGQAVVGSTFLVDDITFIENPASIQETSFEQWSVYPNPVQDILRIDSNSKKSAVLEVLDVTGKTIGVHSISGVNAEVDMRGLSEGIYLYQLKDLSGAILKTGKVLRVN